MHIKKMKKEQDKDIGHVSVYAALLFLLLEQVVGFRNTRQRPFSAPFFDPVSLAFL